MVAIYIPQIQRTPDSCERVPCLYQGSPARRTAVIDLEGVLMDPYCASVEGYAAWGAAGSEWIGVAYIRADRLPDLTGFMDRGSTISPSDYANNRTYDFVIRLTTNPSGAERWISMRAAGSIVRGRPQDVIDGLNEGIAMVWPTESLAGPRNIWSRQV